MRDTPKRWYPALLALVAVALSAAAWPRLPARMVTHWDLSGAPNGWMSRDVAAFLMPGLLLAVAGVMRALPALDPRREHYARFAGTYEFTIGAVLVFLFLLHLCLLATSLGYDVPIGRAAPVLTGILFVAIGNVLPRLRSNFWYGIRTPWTLADDRVWARTHRVAGNAMTAAGVVMALAGALLPPPAGILVVIGAALAATVGPAAYSYFLWKHQAAS